MPARVENMVDLMQRLVDRDAAPHELQRAAIAIVLSARSASTVTAATKLANVATLMQDDPEARDSYVPALGDCVARLKESVGGYPSQVRGGAL
jgi:hypothetical protein